MIHLLAAPAECNADELDHVLEVCEYRMDDTGTLPEALIRTRYGDLRSVPLIDLQILPLAESEAP